MSGEAAPMAFTAGIYPRKLMGILHGNVPFLFLVFNSVSSFLAMVKIASDLVLWDLKIFAFEISAHFFCFQPWKAKKPQNKPIQELKGTLVSLSSCTNFYQNPFSPPSKLSEHVPNQVVN